MSKPRVAGLIPARYGSTRLPGKALELIRGKPMIQRVYERCQKSEVLDVVAVATDDKRIADAVRAWGGEAIMTAAEHPSGTDRLAEAVRAIEADIVVNIQGDQPFINPVMIDEAVQPLIEEESVEMSTVIHPIHRTEDLENVGVVKTVVDRVGNALYFSRSLIPYPRQAVPHTVYEHVGLYVYRKDFLIKLAALPPTILEQVESLEQLRVLEYGYRIRCVETRCADHEFSGFSVDTLEDLQRAEAMLRERGLA
ncbi:MAG: 3-deoxy-manno-octulosonate cytidylyltransferase [Candidatus Hydrogenedentes bacterium]|nr:3-deoxy-manno-octulosonate cytidylyltransferase [Candidatus Hydrogenedentota bacterium]